MLCFVRSLGLPETGDIWEWWRTWRRDTLLHFFLFFRLRFWHISFLLHALSYRESCFLCRFFFFFFYWTAGLFYELIIIIRGVADCKAFFCWKYSWWEVAYSFLQLEAGRGDYNGMEKINTFHNKAFLDAGLGSILVGRRWGFLQLSDIRACSWGGGICIYS